MSVPAHELGIDLATDSGVIIEIAPKLRLHGSGYEWTYRFRREYDYGGESRVAFFFRREHDTDLGLALVQAIQWMNTNDPNTWVRKHAA